MYDRSHLTRLTTAALASCAVTWAMAGAALARPDVSSQAGASPAPAFKAVAGDTNKAPGAGPGFEAVAGDTAKAPDPRQVERVLNGIGRGTAPGRPAGVTTTDGSTGTIALIVAIVAMLTALVAVSLTVMRAPRPLLRA